MKLNETELSQLRRDEIKIWRGKILKIFLDLNGLFRRTREAASSEFVFIFPQLCTFTITVHLINHHYCRFEPGKNNKIKQFI